VRQRSVDLTQIDAPEELRRPPASPGDQAGRHGIKQTVHSDCGAIENPPEVQTTLVGLDRSTYQISAPTHRFPLPVSYLPCAR